MKIFVSITLVLISLVMTYFLMGKFQYSGPVTEIAISDGPDINRPYQDKYGVFGYAYARDYYESGSIIERRIESLDTFRLALSNALVSLVWIITTLAILRIAKGKPQADRTVGM